MNKKQIIDKIVNDLPMNDMLGKMTKEEWHGWFEECWDKAINYTCCCTELKVVDSDNDWIEEVIDKEALSADWRRDNL
jgi:aspartate/glutamate racemase